MRVPLLLTLSLLALSCDGEPDEDTHSDSCYYWCPDTGPEWGCRDGDGDGYGAWWDEGMLREGDVVADCSDCDDADAMVNAAATEICDDGLDNDCDGLDEPCQERPAGAGPLGELWATQADAMLWSAEADERVGMDLDAGDLDGDGAPELVLAVERQYSNAGEDRMAFVLPGDLEGDTDLLDASALLIAPENVLDVHVQVAVLDDASGDGIPDLLVGDYAWSADGVSERGAAFLLAGPITGTLDVEAEAVLTMLGESDSQRMGGVVSGLRFFGDGTEDLLVAQREYPAPVRTCVLDGARTGTLSLSDADLVIEAGGTAVGALGDLGGDGHDELAAFSSGVVGVYSGPLRGTISGEDADYHLPAELFGAGIGQAVYDGADMDGDGYRDLLLGLRNSYDEVTDLDLGQLFLVAGPITASPTQEDILAIVTGETPDGWAGASLSTGDVDADGVRDLVVGAPYARGQRGGAVYVVLGPLEGVVDLGDAQGVVVAGGAGQLLGGAVVSGFDGDHDGFDDLLLGAPGVRHEDNTTGCTTGAAYLFRGGTMAW